MQSVAVIGLGIMGTAIARNLAAAGFAVSGYGHHPAEELARDGVRIATSAVDAVRGAEVAVTLLPTVESLEETVVELVAAPQQGLVIFEMGTFPLEAKEAARDRLAAVGVTLLDSPVSGTGAQAMARDLAIYASGDEEAFERCRGVLDGFARAAHYLGPFGNGSRMKFVANLLAAVHNLAAAEAIVLGTKSGLDPNVIIDVISNGAGYSRALELRGPMMAKGVYMPATATMRVLEKDIGIIVGYARSLGVETPLLDTAAPIYQEADKTGYDHHDAAAVHAILARRAGL